MFDLATISQAPAQAMAYMQQLRYAGQCAVQEARGGISSRFLSANLEGPIRDSHSGDAGPTEFDIFDTIPSVGLTGQISAVVGTTVTLYAQVSNTSEAGMIIMPQASTMEWTLASGAGGWQGWGISNLAWSLSSPSNFQATYQPIPSNGAGYMCPDYFNVNFCMGPNRHTYKPLHGMTIDSGGQITVQLTVRALGPAGTTVIWPGACITACSTKACEIIGQMQPWSKDSFGPLKLKHLFAQAGTSRLSSIRGLLGGGNLPRLLQSSQPLLIPQSASFAPNPPVQMYP